MNLVSHLIQRQMRLDAPLTRELAVELDLRVPMPDGTVLLANRWRRRLAATVSRWRCCAAN